MVSPEQSHQGTSAGFRGLWYSGPPRWQLQIPQSTRWRYLFDPVDKLQNL